MTVGIVAYVQENNLFIGASDSMLSMYDMSADRFAFKAFAIADSWMCLFSANDISSVVAIRNVVSDSLEGDVTLAEVISAFQAAFRKELISKAEATILAPLGMSLAEFRANGFSNFGAEHFSRLLYQIESLTLEATFLVYGFQGTEPHIFTIEKRGEVSHFDDPGFWAIGSGQTAALGSLFNVSGDSVVFRHTEDALYLICKAKFISECAPGVGRSTTVNILHDRTERFNIHYPEIEMIRNIWESSRPPDIPAGIQPQVKDIIKKSQKEFSKWVKRRGKEQIEAAKAVAKQKAPAGIGARQTKDRASQK